MEDDIDRGEVAVDVAQAVEVVEGAQERHGVVDDLLRAAGRAVRQGRAMAQLEDSVGAPRGPVDAEAVGADEARVGQAPEEIELGDEVVSETRLVKDLAGIWHTACKAVPYKQDVSHAAASQLAHHRVAPVDMSRMCGH